MSNHSFSKSAAIGYGWRIMKSNFWFFLKLEVVFVVVMVLLAIAPLVVPNGMRFSLVTGLGLFVLGVVRFVVQLTMGLGLVKITLNLYDNLVVSVIDLFRLYKLVVKFFIASIFVGIGCLPILIAILVAQRSVFFGAVLALVFAIFAILWTLRLSFYRYFLVDRCCGIFASLEKSGAITKGHVWNLFCFYILLGIINMVGAFCLLIGLIATIPMSMMATVFVYRQLLMLWEEREAGKADIAVEN